MKRFLLVVLYIASYIIIALNVDSIPTCFYYLIVICVCKYLSKCFTQSIDLSSQKKEFRERGVRLKPFPTLSLRGGLYTFTFALTSFLIQTHHNAQCTLMAFITASVIFPTMVNAVKMLYANDPYWLVAPGEEYSNPDGNIGLPNAISIIRIATAAVLPPMFIWASGEQYKTVCFIMLVGVIMTDWIDGHIARITRSITKAGKYLDPLGDKVLFIPNGLAFVFILATGQIISRNQLYLVATLVLLTIARDILFFIWFATMSKKYPKGVGAGLTDKIRMVAISSWLIVTANLVSVGFFQQASIVLGLVLTITMAFFSGVSIIADMYRLKKA
jgi:CDP-diacylglycerol--glycerol-3-phosphate 3-phosphatidyltransferase